MARGTASFKICRRLETISNPASMLTPVGLPPGCARLVTSPAAIGSPVIPTIGNRGGGHRERTDQTVGVRKDDVRVAAYDRGGERGEALGASLGRIALDDEMAGLRVAKLAQRLVEPPYPERAGALGEQVSGAAGMDERDAALLLG